MSVHCIKRVLFTIRKSEKTCSWTVRNMPSCSTKVYLTYVVLSMYIMTWSDFKARKPQAHYTVWTWYCNIEQNAKKSFSGCLDIFLKDTINLSSRRLAKALILTNEKKIHKVTLFLCIWLPEITWRRLKARAHWK